MKFDGGVQSSTRKNWLNFGGDLGIVRWVNEQNNTIIVVAYPDRGAGNDPEPAIIFTSLAKEVMSLVVLASLSVCLSACLFVCGQHYSNSYERIGMKFDGGVQSSTRKNWLNFGGDLGIVRWVNEQNNTVIVVAYPDRGEGNDPEPFYFFRGVGSLSQPRLNIFTVGNMRAMICLGQGGLRSLSVSSLFYF